MGAPRPTLGRTSYSASSLQYYMPSFKNKWSCLKFFVLPLCHVVVYHTRWYGTCTMLHRSFLSAPITSFMASRCIYMMFL